MSPAEVMAAYAAAWERGDPPAAWEFYGDDVVMNLPGRGALAGAHRGKEQVIAAIESLLQRTGDSSAEVEVIDILASGDRVAMVIREAAHRDDAHLELFRVNVYRIVDETIVQIDIYEANQYEVDEFFG